MKDYDLPVILWRDSKWDQGIQEVEKEVGHHWHRNHLRSCLSHPEALQKRRRILENCSPESSLVGAQHLRLLHYGLQS